MICYRHFVMSGKWRVTTLLAGMVGVWIVAAVSSAEAIDVQPTPRHIQAALERGKVAAQARMPPDRLYVWFGSNAELEPRGFMMTKMAGLSVMAAHFALRSETPTAMDVQHILDEKTLLVSVNIFGSSPTFAVDSYMVLTQGDKTVKPLNVRFDGQANRTSVWPQMPAYRARVVASFAYDDINPRAKTKISVFPAGGGEVAFDLDFATIE